MKRLTRLISVVTGIVLLGLLITSPVLAIDSPDSLQIDSVYVYHHCLETNDQLYLIEYTIDYSISGNPTENATEAYLFRFLDGLTELNAIVPYAYFDDGYGKGIAAIYFDANDPALPTWLDPYTIRLEGNPTLTWSAGVPLTSVAVFDSWSSSTSITQTRSELAARILYLADMLEIEWGINMIDTTGTGSYLSDYGIAYFTSVIPDCRTMAPSALPGGTTAPDYSTKDIGTTYADSRAASVTGTLLDTDPLANWLGVSRIWTSSLLYIVAIILMLYFTLSPQGRFKPMLLLSAPLIIAGGYLGMIPLVATVLTGVAAFGLSCFMLFYHPSGA